MDFSKKLDSTTGAFLQTLEKGGGKPLYELSPSEAREILLDLQDISVNKRPVDMIDKTIPVGPKGSVSITIYRPKGTIENLPTAMFFHGGGWVLGDKNTHDRFVRDFVHTANVALVFVNYTNAPEGQYPLQIEEAYAATKYVAEHGAELNLDSSQLALVGDSVGGNMAIVVALLAKERKGPQFIYQILFYPVADATFDTESYKEFENGPWLTKKAMQWFWDSYLPDKNKRKEHTASPLQSTLEQLKDLPPTLIMVNEFDVLRDEGEALAHKLIEAGVKVTAIRHLATIHDSALLNAIANTPACKNSISTAAYHLRRAFALNKLKQTKGEEEQISF